MDNFGDIGFVYRLARRFSEIATNKHLNIIVDNLYAFNLLCPEIFAQNDNPQKLGNWTIFDWNDSTNCTSYFQKNFPQIILECFQCGRPNWLENILFPPKKSNKDHENTPNPICQIINIDYLTAENYAETFHRLQSLTRNVFVKKINFMPGFTNKTAGLILDNNFLLCKKKHSQNKLKKHFRLLIFTYKKNFMPILYSLNSFSSSCGKIVEISVAQGNGQKKFFFDAHIFFQSTKNTNPSQIQITELPFLKQTEWDNNLFTFDFLFIRGEDSLSRAVLSGIPFIWHAYEQDEDYQLIKVQALLEKMQPFFKPDDFVFLSNLWIQFNTSLTHINEKEISANLFYILKNLDSYKHGFNSFADHIQKIGDFGEHLLTFIEECKIFS